MSVMGKVEKMLSCGDPACGVRVTLEAAESPPAPTMAPSPSSDGDHSRSSHPAQIDRTKIPFAVDDTPTPSRYIRNQFASEGLFEEVCAGLNPFDEQFRRACVRTQPHIGLESTTPHIMEVSSRYTSDSHNNSNSNNLLQNSSNSSSYNATHAANGCNSRRQAPNYNSSGEDESLETPRIVSPTPTPADSDHTITSTSRDDLHYHANNSHHHSNNHHRHHPYHQHDRLRRNNNHYSLNNNIVIDVHNSEDVDNSNGSDCVECGSGSGSLYNSTATGGSAASSNIGQNGAGDHSNPFSVTSSYLSVPKSLPFRSISELSARMSGREVTIHDDQDDLDEDVAAAVAARDEVRVVEDDQDVVEYDVHHNSCPPSSHRSSDGSVAVDERRRSSSSTSRLRLIMKSTTTELDGNNDSVDMHQSTDLADADSASSVLPEHAVNKQRLQTASVHCSPSSVGSNPGSVMSTNAGGKEINFQGEVRNVTNHHQRMEIDVVDVLSTEGVSQHTESGLTPLSSASSGISICGGLINDSSNTADSGSSSCVGGGGLIRRSSVGRSGLVRQKLSINVTSAVEAGRNSSTVISTPTPVITAGPSLTQCLRVAATASRESESNHDHDNNINSSPTRLDSQSPYHQHHTTDLYNGQSDHQHHNDDHQHLNSNHQHPNSNHQHPNSNHQHPNSNHQHPNSNHQHPNSNHQLRHSDHHHHENDHCKQQQARHRHGSEASLYSSFDSGLQQSAEDNGVSNVINIADSFPQNEVHHDNSSTSTYTSCPQSSANTSDYFTVDDASIVDSMRSFNSTFNNCDNSINRINGNKPDRLISRQRNRTTSGCRVSDNSRLSTDLGFEGRARSLQATTATNSAGEVSSAAAEGLTSIAGSASAAGVVSSVCSEAGMVGGATLGIPAGATVVSAPALPPQSPSATVLQLVLRLPNGQAIPLEFPATPLLSASPAASASSPAHSTTIITTTTTNSTPAAPLVQPQQPSLAKMRLKAALTSNHNAARPLPRPPPSRAHTAHRIATMTQSHLPPGAGQNEPAKHEPETCIGSPASSQSKDDKLLGSGGGRGAASLVPATTTSAGAVDAVVSAAAASAVLQSLINHNTGGSGHGHSAGGSEPAERQKVAQSPRGQKRALAAPQEQGEKRTKFLERNRAAAVRCREKKKEWVLRLASKSSELASVNTRLQSEVAGLRAEVATLKTLLLRHRTCPVTLADLREGQDGSSQPPNAMSVDQPLSSGAMEMTAVSQPQQLHSRAVHPAVLDLSTLTEGPLKPRSRSMSLPSIQANSITAGPAAAASAGRVAAAPIAAAAGGTAGTATLLGAYAAAVAATTSTNSFTNQTATSVSRKTSMPALMLPYQVTSVPSESCITDLSHPAINVASAGAGSVAVVHSQQQQQPSFLPAGLHQATLAPGSLPTLLAANQPTIVSVTQAGLIPMAQSTLIPVSQQAFIPISQAAAALIPVGSQHPTTIITTSNQPSTLVNAVNPQPGLFSAYHSTAPITVPSHHIGVSHTLPTLAPAPPPPHAMTAASGGSPSSSTLPVSSKEQFTLTSLASSIQFVQSVLTSSSRMLSAARPSPLTEFAASSATDSAGQKAILLGTSLPPRLLLPPACAASIAPHLLTSLAPQQQCHITQHSLQPHSVTQALAHPVIQAHLTQPLAQTQTTQSLVLPVTQPLTHSLMQPVTPSLTQQHLTLPSQHGQQHQSLSTIEEAPSTAAIIEDIAEFEDINNCSKMAAAAASNNSAAAASNNDNMAVATCVHNSIVDAPSSNTMVACSTMGTKGCGDGAQEVCGSPTKFKEYSVPLIKSPVNGTAAAGAITCGVGSGGAAEAGGVGTDAVNSSSVLQASSPSRGTHVTETNASPHHQNVGQPVPGNSCIAVCTTNSSTSFSSNGQNFGFTVTADASNTTTENSLSTDNILNSIVPVYSVNTATHCDDRQSNARAAYETPLSATADGRLTSKANADLTYASPQRSDTDLLNNAAATVILNENQAASSINEDHRASSYSARSSNSVCNEGDIGNISDCSEQAVELRTADLSTTMDLSPATSSTSVRSSPAALSMNNGT